MDEPWRTIVLGFEAYWRIIALAVEVLALYLSWRFNWGLRLVTWLYRRLTGPVSQQPGRLRSRIRRELLQGATSLSLLRGTAWEEHRVLQSLLLSALALFSILVLIRGTEGVLDSAVALAVTVLGPLWGLAILNYVVYPIVARRAFDRQVPEALMIMSEEVRVGRSLEQGLYRVVQHLGEPLRTEFSRVQLRVAAGSVPVEQLLVDLAGSGTYRNRDLEMAAVCLMATKPLGGDVAKLLGDLARTVHRRREIELEIGHILAAGKVSALLLTCIIGLAELAILFALPVAFSGFAVAEYKRLWDYYDGRTWLLAIGFLFTTGIVLTLRVLARRA